VHDADIVCLQEVDQEGYHEYFRRELAYQDYRGVFSPKTRAKTMADREAKFVDGCATFFKSSKYICLDKHVIDFANMAINRPDMKGEHDTFNRVMPRDQIAVVTFFENRATGSRLVVVNVHIHWDPAYKDVKLVQVAILMEQVSKLADRWAKHPPCTEKTAFQHADLDGEDGVSATRGLQEVLAPSQEYSSGTQIPLLVCGDFNSSAGSGVYDLMAQGSVSGKHEDLGNYSYGNFTRDGMAHPFTLKSAYSGTDELSITNYTPDFSDVIDYIWYSSNGLQIRGVLGNVDMEYLSKVPGFPNHHFPSDHLPLRAEFSVKSRKEIKAVEAKYKAAGWSMAAFGREVERRYSMEASTKRPTSRQASMIVLPPFSAISLQLAPACPQQGAMDMCSLANGNAAQSVRIESYSWGPLPGAPIPFHSIHTIPEIQYQTLRYLPTHLVLPHSRPPKGNPPYHTTPANCTDHTPTFHRHRIRATSNHLHLARRRLFLSATLAVVIRLHLNSHHNPPLFALPVFTTVFNLRVTHLVLFSAPSPATVIVSTPSRHPRLRSRWEKYAHLAAAIVLFAVLLNPSTAQF
ncbi:MAG: hypothetical protein L6R42_002003, partial [Xanthoria sp. 1 TBL-2021]